MDPERDTSNVLEKYIKEFSSKLIGLTGTKQQISDVCKKFRVYFSAGPKDKDDDYIVSISVHMDAFHRYRTNWRSKLIFQVDHTIVLYLIDPKGEFVDYYGQNKKRDEVTNEILFAVTKYNAKNK